MKTLNFSCQWRMIEGRDTGYPILPRSRMTRFREPGWTVAQESGFWTSTVTVSSWVPATWSETTLNLVCATASRANRSRLCAKPRQQNLQTPTVELTSKQDTVSTTVPTPSSATTKPAPGGVKTKTSTTKAFFPGRDYTLSFLNAFWDYL